jgi:hypothetical protein
MGQAAKSFQKAKDHKAASTSGDRKIGTHLYDSQHFWRVGALWVVGASAAAVTVVAEIVDFYNDGLGW